MFPPATVQFRFSSESTLQNLDCTSFTPPGNGFFFRTKKATSMTAKKVTITSQKQENSRTEIVGKYPFDVCVGDFHDNIQSTFFGVLATFSREKSNSNGYPFNSISPYVLDKDGYPIIMAATISQHHRNILENPKVSLFVRQETLQGNPQTKWRFTLMGTAEMLEKDDPAAAIYHNIYASTKSYHNVHDFNYFRIKPDIVHMIQNFGKIAWLDWVDLDSKCPLSDEEISAAINHMNEGHSAALYQYLKNADVPVDTERKISLVDLNHRRFVVSHQNEVTSISFPEPVTTSEELRKAMVALAKPNNAPAEASTGE